MRIYQSEIDDYIEMPVIGRVRYLGETFSFGLTDGSVYPVVRIEYGLLGIVDDTNEDYLYSSINPGPFDDSGPTGKWEIIDDPNGTLSKSLAF